jgi:hypothetical protein
MKPIEAHRIKAYRCHVRCTLLLVSYALGACASAEPSVPLEAPSEASRHRAALATVIVSNATDGILAIAFQSATPPLQEVTIGSVTAIGQARMAPVPAGEPIVLIARRADGSELRLGARSFAPDAEWTWEIPRDAIFAKTDRGN